MPLDDEQPSDTRGLILAAIDNTYNTKKFLELCLVIYEMEEETADAKKVEKTLKNLELMRDLSIVSTIKENPEDRIYYLDRDKSTGALQYQKEMESFISEVTITNLKKLSSILKRLNAGEEIQL
jgi:hypothetical protein